MLRWSLKPPEIAALPGAHSLTHSRLCQAIFSTLFVLGNGLSCGEEIETLWSKLRLLWTKLKNMTPANRHDELQDALREISRVAVEGIADMMTQMDAKIAANLAWVESFLPRLRPSVTEESAKQWYNEYLANDENHIVFQWEETYVMLLQALATDPLKEELTKSLRNIETKQNMMRWELNSPQFEYHYKAALNKQMEHKRHDMILADQDYQCSLGILRNHEQHNYAQRAQMSRSVTKASSRLHQHIGEWNEIRSKLNLELLSIKTIRELRVLEWTYGTTINDQNKQNYYFYEAISLRDRAMEERAYLNKEIVCLLGFGVEEAKRWMERYSKGERFVAHQLHQSRLRLSKWYRRFLPIVLRESIVIDLNMIQSLRAE